MSFWSKSMLWLVHVGLALMAVTMFSYLITTKMTILEFGDPFCYSLIVIQGTIKMFFFQWNRGSISVFINALNALDKKIIAKATSNPAIKSLRNGYYLREMYLTVVLLAFYKMAVVFLCVKIVGSIEKRLPLLALYPFDITPYTWGFVTAYIFQTITAYWFTISYILIDSLIWTIFSQLILQIDVLGYELSQIGHNGESQTQCNAELERISKEYCELEK